MRNVFINEIKNEHGEVIKEVYNWYSIGFCVLLSIVVIGVTIYYFSNSDGEGDDELHFFQNNEEKITNEILEMWRIDQETCWLKFGMSKAHLVRKLDYIAREHPEVFEELTSHRFTDVSIELIRSIEWSAFL